MVFILVVAIASVIYTTSDAQAATHILTAPTITASLYI